MCQTAKIQKEGESFHRTLGLTLELFEIDNPELFKKYTGHVEAPEVVQLFHKCKDLVDPKKYLLVDGNVSRSNKYYTILLEDLGLATDA